MAAQTRKERRPRAIATPVLASQQPFFDPDPVEIAGPDALHINAVALESDPCAAIHEEMLL